MDYYYFSILLASLVIAFSLFVGLIKSEKLVVFILVLFASILLIWKTIEFTYYGLTHTGTYPIEISHISYFVFSVIILSGIKKLYFAGGIFAFISGCGYTLAGLVSPKSIVTSLDFPIFVMGVISHMMLLLGGMLTLFKYSKYDLKHFYFPIIGLILACILAYLAENHYIYPDATGLDNLVIIKLINGSILSYLGVDLDNQLLNWSVTILIFVLVGVLIFLINVFNNYLFKSKVNKPCNKIKRSSLILNFFGLFMCLCYFILFHFVWHIVVINNGNKCYG